MRFLRADEVFKLKGIAQEFTNSAKLNLNWPHLKKNITKIIKIDTGRVLVSEKDNKIVGVLGFLVHHDFIDNTLTASELFWYVFPKYRGIGLELLKEFEKFAEENNIKRIHMVYLLKSMPERIKRIYELRGYTPVENSYRKEL